MKIVVYGLGIIGASLAGALKRAGHTVLGKNRSRAPIEYALAHGIVDGEASGYEGAEVVILALPPRPAMEELDRGDFPAGAIVADVCGVKECVEKLVLSKPRAYRYVGLHPMAGKERSGIAVSDSGLFVGKNLVVTLNEGTDEEALSVISRLADDCGFGRIVRCSAAVHDRKIALTSQLAHIVSNAYIRSGEAEGVAGFTGGSYQDMTRVGGVDEDLWTDLYLLNRDSLVRETRALARRLGEYCDLLEKGDEEGLRALLKEGRLAHERYFSEK